MDAVREAERLVREATERGQQIAGDVPPRGYEEPRRAAPGTAPPCPDLPALAGLVPLPRDLQRQLQQALRELLIALRAVLDYSIDRLEPGREPPPAAVEDIPIS